jgi:hypothetical protein
MILTQNKCVKNYKVDRYFLHRLQNVMVIHDWLLEIIMEIYI